MTERSLKETIGIVLGVILAIIIGSLLTTFVPFLFWAGVIIILFGVAVAAVFVYSQFR